jgi:hypothetical protein
MRFSIAGLTALLALSTPPAAASPDDVPLACSGPDMSDTDAEKVEAPLPGTYRCSEEGITITLTLEPDGRFEQRMTSDEAVFEREGGGLGTEYALSGQWRAEHGRLYLFQQPTRAPRIRLAEARNDPSVELRVEIRTPGGQPAADLFIGEGAEANPRSSLGDGLLIVPSGEAWKAGRHWIVRNGDELRLASFDTAPGGNNSFRYVYEPSEVEPFQQRGMVAGIHGEIVVVPLGIGGAVLRRIDASE